MNSLSLRALARCEQAQEPVCKCRCGGAFHGAKRGGENPGKDFFESLPDDDPHHLMTKQEKQAARNAANREKTRLKNEKIMRAYERLWSTKEGQS